MKKIAIMQPYLLPYIGYFQLISSVDLFVLYDDVAYKKGGYINRNNLLLNGKKHLWNLPLNGASPNVLINELTVHEPDKNKKKVLELHLNAYRKAPYFKNVAPLLNEIFLSSENDITSFIEHSLTVVNNYLGINTEIIRSSSFKKDFTLAAEPRLVQMVKYLNGDSYINSIGGTELYTKQFWLENGLQLNFLQPKIVNYVQSLNEFLPYLSVIDVLMYNSRENCQSMVKDYEIV